MNVHLSKENIFANSFLLTKQNTITYTLHLTITLLSSPYCIEHKQLIIYKLYNKNPKTKFVDRCLVKRLIYGM